MQISKKLDLSNFDISNVTNMYQMFCRCDSLISLDISSFDFSNTPNTLFLLSGCYSLTDLKFGKNLKISLKLYDSPLSHESALSVIDGLAEVEEQQEVLFSEETYKTLTAEEIKKATDKNWEISHYTKDE